jgi:hypothetical protein
MRDEGWFIHFAFPEGNLFSLNVPRYCMKRIKKMMGWTAFLNGEAKKSCLSL